MGVFSFLYNNIIYKPLLNGLIFLINTLPLHDIGIAIIILTIAVRIIIFPLNHRAIITQMKMKKIEPELRKIKEDHKDKEEQARKTMALYRAHGVNPFSTFLVMIIQIPIIFALYKVFLLGGKFDSSHLYSFITTPSAINPYFLGLIDLSKTSYILAALAALSQFIQIKLATPPSPPKSGGSSKSDFKDDLTRSMAFQMKYIMPIFVFIIALKLTSAISLYWTTMNIFAIVHEVIVKRKSEKIYESGSYQANQIPSGGNSS
ncbi:MAG TPA: YidC/Oxa1 family membrane protein insertase [Candidatus Paceibacterota bacterium]